MGGKEPAVPTYGGGVGRQGSGQGSGECKGPRASRQALVLLEEWKSGQRS